MSQVSIGQIENLSRAVVSLNSSIQEAESESSSRISGVEQKYAETEAAMNDAIRATLEAERELLAAEMEVSRAEVALAAAEIAVSQAQATLAVAAAGGTLIAAAEATLIAAEAELMEAQAMLVQAQQRLAEAIHRLDAARLREELARVNFQQAGMLLEQVRLECSVRLREINVRTAEGIARLENAKRSLDGYLDSHPDAKAIYDWLYWQPSVNQPVMPRVIHDRLNLSPSQQGILIQYLSETDIGFRSKIAGYRARLDAANGQVERDMVYTQMKKSLSGEYAEKMVEYALGPLGKDAQVHVEYVLKDGKKTFTDIIISNLKEPVIIGKGLSVPKGGSIAIEIKTGHKKYLKSEREHMVRQAAGHADADAAVVLCSRNIRDLLPEDQAELRVAVKAANSRILAMLPQKDDIDQALWKSILGEAAGW
jgi:hypothetical protein